MTENKVWAFKCNFFLDKNPNLLLTPRTLEIIFVLWCCLTGVELRLMKCDFSDIIFLLWNCFVSAAHCSLVVKRVTFWGLCFTPAPLWQLELSSSHCCALNRQFGAFNHLGLFTRHILPWVLLGEVSRVFRNVTWNVTTDFSAPLVLETFWIIHFAGPTEVTASKRSPTVPERSAWSSHGLRYRPAKLAADVGYRNGSGRVGVPEPRPRGDIPPTN